MEGAWEVRRERRPELRSRVDAARDARDGRDARSDTRRGADATPDARNRADTPRDSRSRADAPRRPRRATDASRRTICTTPLLPGLESPLITGTSDRRAPRFAFAPERWAQMARGVGLAHDAAVIVALSGGADSMFLLHVVAASRPRPRLVAVHIDHGLRAASREDARFCRDACRALDVPFVVRELVLDPRMPSLEARAREARYRTLCEEAARLSIPTLLTGHHADDALETLLQRWLRGTDLHGLAGLHARLALRARDAGIERDARDAHERDLLNPTDRDVEIVRPLIAMRREEVRSRLRESGVEWREDDSNESLRFTRNRVRNLLLPEIERVCGASAIEHLRAFGRAVETLEENCAVLTAGIAWGAPAFAAACRSARDAALGGTLERERLIELSPALRRRALWRLLVEGTGRAPSRAHLESVLADLELGRCARHALPGRWTLQLRSDLVHLEPPPSRASADRSRTSSDQARRAQHSIARRAERARPQLAFAFGDGERAASERLGARRGLRLEIPGCVVLDDGRRIVAELIDAPPAREIPRSPTCVELDAGELDGPWHVRWPEPGDRFHALGAPGRKKLGRFFTGIGLPRRDRARVPLVFDARELVWIAGVRPSETRRVRATTVERVRLSLLPGP